MVIIGKSLTALGGGLKPEITVTTKAGALLNLHYKDSSIILQSYQLGESETQHTFVVNVSETAYVVEDVTNSASVEVLVDAVAQYSVEIEYVTWLYKDGDECEDTSGGWSKISASGRPDASITKNNTNISWTIVNNALLRIATNNQIDLTNYTKLVFQCAQTVSGTVGGTAFIHGACSNPTAPTVSMSNEGTVAYKDPMLNVSYELTNVEVDISEISGSYYPYVRIDITPGASLTVNGVLYKVWNKEGEHLCHFLNLILVCRATSRKP